MTKTLSKTQNKTTEMKKREVDVTFSQWELDAAYLLLQLNNDHCIKPHKKQIDKDLPNEEQSCEFFTSFSPLTAEDIEEILNDEQQEEDYDSYDFDELDGYPERRKKRFKLVEEIYSVTQPIESKEFQTIGLIYSSIQPIEWKKQDD